jgi:hypothetical protein
MWSIRLRTICLDKYADYILTPHNKRILGFGVSHSIDSGTLARVRHLPPGIIDGESNDSSGSRREALLDERWEAALAKDRRTLTALREYRDSIISYDVHARESSLPASRKGTIRLKLKRKPGESNGKITYVAKKTRPLSDIGSLVLHSTAGPERAVEKYWDFSVHFVITPSGTIIQNHEENVKAYGSSGFNSRSVAVEFVGLFKRGHDRRGNELWAKGSTLRHVPTTAQIYSGRNLVRYLNKTIGIKYVLAHSQAAAKNCPGPEIWFNVGEWAINNALSADGRNITTGGGKSIPSDWRDDKWDFRKFLLAPST